MFRKLSFALLAAAGLAGQANAQYVFHGMGGFGSSGSYPSSFGISGDGRSAVGSALDGTTQHGIRWQYPNWTAQDQGTIDGTHTSIARAIDFDGNVTTGESGDGNLHAYRWTSSGMADLGTLAGDAQSVGLAINHDGSAIAGNSGTSRAFRWTSSDGMADLGMLAGDTLATAQGISGDGTRVVGSSSTSSVSHAYLWTLGSGMQNLGNLGGTWVSADAISEDGNVVVGSSTMAGGATHAFRWTSGSGMVDLGGLGSYTQFIATGVSGDGSVIVGDASGAGSTEFLWTLGTGMVDLPTYLRSHGASFADSEIAGVGGVSADGTTFFGNGTGILGTHPSAWVAYTTAPEPGTLAVLALGALALLRRRKR